MIRSEITDQRFNFSHFYTTNYKDTIFRRHAHFPKVPVVTDIQEAHTRARTADGGPDHPPFAVPAASEGPTATAHLTDKAALSQRRSPQRARKSQGPLRPTEGHLTSAEGTLDLADGPLRPSKRHLTPAEGHLMSAEDPLRPSEAFDAGAGPIGAF